MSANIGIDRDSKGHAITEYYGGVIDSVALYKKTLSSLDAVKLWRAGYKFMEFPVWSSIMK